MPEEVQVTDLTMGEMRSILASLVGCTAEQIGGWALIVRMGCGAPDCIGPGCEAGPLALLSAGQSDGNRGDSVPYLLHMFGSAIEELARAMRDRQ